MENPVVPCEDALSGSGEPKQSSQPTHRHKTSHAQSKESSPVATTPVQSIAHFDCHQHRQRHRRWVSRLEDLTVNSFEDGVVLSAPHEVPLSAQETAGKYMAEQQERQERGGRVDWLGGTR